MKSSKVLLAVCAVLLTLGWVITWLQPGPDGGGDVIGLIWLTVMILTLAGAVMSVRDVGDALLLLFAGRALLFCYVVPVLCTRKLLSDPNVIFHGNSFGQGAVTNAFAFAAGPASRSSRSASAWGSRVRAAP